MALKPVNSFGGNPSSREVIKELQQKVIDLATLCNDLKAKYNTAVTLINELKADYNGHVAAASLHYSGTASVTDATRNTTTADALASSVANVTT